MYLLPGKERVSAALLLLDLTNGECLLFVISGKIVNFQNMLPVYSRRKLTLNV